MTDLAMDFSFLENPVLVGPNNEVYCVNTGGALNRIAGFGPDQPLIAIECGSSAMVNWLLANRALGLFDKTSGEWHVKDLSTLNKQGECRVRQFQADCPLVFWLCISFGDDLYTLSVSAQGIQEFVIERPLKLGCFWQVGKSVISYLGYADNAVQQLITTADTGEASLVFGDGDEAFFEWLGGQLSLRNSLHFPLAAATENIVDCLAGFTKTGDRTVLLQVKAGEQAQGILLVKIGIDNLKHPLQYFPDTRFISQLDIDAKLCFFYLAKENTNNILCIKYDSGDYQWGDCHIDGEPNWDLSIDRFLHAESVGIFALAIPKTTRPDPSGEKLSEKMAIVKSNDGLDFETVLKLPRTDH
ncbi:hypothetical protein FKG94_06485 [Exilibacterium tricleocarpae]|uniref:Uncharacterized protein n=1 Tax=Exilibacterium tricleocarpae TaxID=2591008 RepID=A0A545U4A0_9GAMM|nr:hypothetical protein [Exilibacterium tricleocarpae]TQV84299.1 hypothetical protein FKG94_06485 [Exilibacterium tricleocarpae]